MTTHDDEASDKQLSAKQRAFVEHYLTCWNGYRAAIAAGYSESSARHQASRLLSYANIKAAIAERLAELAMPATEVLARLTQHARGDMADFLRTDEEEITLTWSLIKVPEGEDGKPDLAGVTVDLAMRDRVTPTDRILQTQTITRSVARLDLLAAAREGKLGLVKKYTIDDKGKVAIELYDAQAALVQLGKYHKLFVERTELSGPGGTPITFQAADLAAARAAAAQFEQEAFGE